MSRIALGAAWRRYILTRNFAIGGAAILIAAAAALSVYQSRRDSVHLMTISEEANAALTHVFANFLWPEFREFTATAREMPVANLRAHPRITALHTALRDLMARTAIEKVKIYANDGLTVYSGDPGQIGAEYGANPRFRTAMQGMTASELEFRERFGAFDGPLENRWILSSYVAIRGNSPGAPIEGVAEIYRDVTGQHLWLEQERIASLTIIAGSFAVIYALLLIVVWSTERKLTVQHERALKLTAAVAQAEAAGRAKSSFLANMSHEVRTPINGILGMAALLGKTSLAGKQAHFVKTIADSAQALLQLLNNVLDLSRIEADALKIESKPFDLRQITNGVVDLFCAEAETKNLSLTARIDGAITETPIGDGNRIRQILVNLVGNAMKFTEVGEVELSVTRAQSANGQHQSPDGPMRLRFEVRDTGIGIDEEALDQIFQPFVQADTSVTRRFGGSGLGLTICKQFIELMGGAIGVSSRSGRGTTFWFEVGFAIAPKSKPASPASARHSAGAAWSRLPTAHVLLVEDNPVNAEVARAFLEEAGCAVTLAQNGLEAVRRFRDERFDLVLMDCQMPGLDGYSATEQIREIERQSGRARTPIVAMTANAFLSDRDRCLAAGMDDFLTKPFLQKHLDQILELWAGRGAAARKRPAVA